MKGLKEIFEKNRNLIILISWICVIVYTIASINVLILALSTYKGVDGAYLDPHSLLLFSVISFFLALLVSAYHLSTLIRRRKRRTDRKKLSRQKYIKAKNRPSRRHR